MTRSALVPAVGWAFTANDTVQEPLLPGTAPAPPIAKLVAPAETLLPLKPQPSLNAGADATWTPAGKLKVAAGPENDVAAEPELAKVKLSVDAPPGATGLGAKATDTLVVAHAANGESSSAATAHRRPLWPKPAPAPGNAFIALRP